MKDKQHTGRESRMGMGYGRFFAMIATSTVVMFGLMYLNTYLFSHVFFSETRAYMAILMGATMAIVMLAFMLSMYRSRAANSRSSSGRRLSSRLRSSSSAARSQSAIRATCGR